MPASPEEIARLEEIARQLRRDVIVQTHAGKSGHPGGSLSSADLAAVLYFRFLRHRPDDPEWSERDRVFWSKGHCSPILYAVLVRSGYYPEETLLTFRKLGSPFQGHPARIKTKGVETNGGSLGQGLSVSLGFALGMRRRGSDARSYAFLGDGEVQEGQIWEAAMASAHYKADNLTAILDYNDLQIDGFVHDIMGIEPIADKWRAFGWHVIQLDGHDIARIIGAFDEALAMEGRPTILIARTIKGKGVSFMENVCDWHGKAPNDEEAAKALAELEGGAR
jgi:transketolase